VTNSRAKVRGWLAIVLLLGFPGFAVGQAATPPTPPGSRTTGDQQPSASVLCSPPKKASSRVEAEILKEASSADLHQYLDDSVLPLIRATWYRLVSRSGEKAGGEATVEFTILKDGSVTGVKLTDGAGHAALGDFAMNAVTKSGPFAILPSGFDEQSIDVRTRFEFEPAPPDRPSSVLAKPAGLQMPTYSHVCSPDETAKGSVDCLTHPKPVYSPDPDFSAEARRKGTQGTVLVWTTVGTDGTVRSACASQPLGDGLEEQAVAAVRTWKFEPAVINGKPTDELLGVEVDFHLYHNPTVDFAKNGPATTIRLLPQEANADAEKPGPGSTAFIKTCDGKLSGCILPPHLLFSPEPEKPDAGAPKYSGTVTLGLTVTKEGKPENIRILKSVRPELDKKAIEAVGQWKFEPATKDGKPVAVEIAVEVEFHLN